MRARPSLVAIAIFVASACAMFPAVASAAAAGAQACVTYGCAPARTSHFDTGRPFASPGRYLDVALGAAVRGAPLFLPDWKFKQGAHVGETRNLVIVTTASNRVYAFAEESLLRGERKPLWLQSLGTPSENGCSNLPPPPIGISSTPVIDPVRRLVFVLAMVDDGSRSLRCFDVSRKSGAHVYGHATYYIDALDLDTGAIVARAPLRDQGAAHRPTFDADLVDQRGGLNLVNGGIYVVFGGLYYHDLCAYHGWVVAIDSHQLTRQTFFPLTRRLLGAGAWGPGGAAAAHDGTIYVATGGASTSRARPGPDRVPCASPPAADYADRATYWARLPVGVHPGDQGEFFLSVVHLGLELQGSSHTPELRVLDWFQPEDAESLNARDLELGSSSPLLIPPVDGRATLVVGAKDGSVFLLDQRRLGKWSHALERIKAFVAGAKGAPAYLQIGDQHLVFVSGSGMPGLICYDLEVKNGAPKLVERWNAGVAFGKYSGSPMVAKTGRSATVWIVDAGGDFSKPGVLRAYDAVSGKPLFDSSRSPSDNLGPVPRFPNLGFGSRSVFVGTLRGFACYRLIAGK